MIALIIQFPKYFRLKYVWVKRILWEHVRMSTGTQYSCPNAKQITFKSQAEQAYIPIEKIIGHLSNQPRHPDNVTHQGITISQPHMGTCA